MSLAGELPNEQRPAEAKNSLGSQFRFAAVALGILLISAILAGRAPYWLAIVSVFLFAGPHNWYELRYFLTRMPARWGGLRKWFYGVGLGGAFVLSLLFISARYLSTYWTSETAGSLFISTWNSLFIFWLATLIWLRGRERPNRDWSWVWPLACLLCAGAWYFATWWDMILVYLHPVIALLFMQRVLRRHRPSWLLGYYLVVALAPVVLAVLYWQLASKPDIPGQDPLNMRIAWQSGSGVFTNVSTQFLVAAHTFLEMLHYAVWILAVPLLTLPRKVWSADRTPLAKKSPQWKLVIRLLVIGGLVGVGVLWLCFGLTYFTTRDVYFTLAIFHVLAEFTFLIGTV